MGSLIKSLFGLFKGVKRPWQITGIASTSDYHDYLPTGNDYRKIAPGSQPIKAIIPHDVPELVYNTRYFLRDYRRENKYSARALRLGKGSAPLDVAAMVARLPLTPEDVRHVPRAANGLIKDRGV